METPYIKNEIKKLSLLDSRGYLTENKQLLLAELKKVSEALNIDSVVGQSAPFQWHTTNWYMKF